MGLTDPERDNYTGDFERFDITIPYVGLENGAKEINTRFSPADHKRNRNIIMCMGYQVHVANSVGTIVVGTDPSGVYLTSILGSYVHIEGVHSYAMSIGENNLRLATYSDDGWINVPSRSKFSINDLAAHLYRRYGLTLTAGDKSKMLRLTPPDQVSMLKRLFVKRGGHVWCPLPIDKIHSILQYTKVGEGEFEKEMIASRITSALLESLQHPREVYDDVAKFAHALCRHYFVNVSIQPYDVAKMQLLHAHYSA